jgi:FkbM family methyltransferase
MQREHWQRLTSRVGRWAVAYLERVPGHRGQARLVNVLGRALGPVPLQAAGGVELLVRLDSVMDRSYVVRDRLSHGELLAEIERLRPGAIVVDVGANAGLYTLLAARAVAPGGRVFAFEPSADEFARLGWAVAANGFGNVLASNVALSDAPGFIGFIPGPSDHTGLHRLAAAADVPAGLPLGVPADVPSQVGSRAVARSVWAQRGDVAVPLADGECVALLKIDVEGAELSVLRGFQGLLAARRIERLVVEITDEFLQRFGASASALYAYLAGFGYVPTKGPLAEWQYDEVFYLPS